MIDGTNALGQPVKNDIRTYKNIRKTDTGQGDDCMAGCQPDFLISKKIIS